MAGKIYQKVYDWALARIKDLPPGSPFPGDTAIARSLGASTGTVIKATRALATAGKLEKIRGRGTRTAGLPDAPVHLPAEPAQSSPQLIADQIYRVICAGTIRHGQALPPVKYFSYRFKVTERTVSAAYRLLAGRGLVSRVGKVFWVGRLEHLIREPARREVYLLRFNSSDFTPLFAGDVMAQAYRRLEQELLLHGYLVRYANSARLKELAGSWAARENIPAGLVCNFARPARMKPVMDTIRNLRRISGQDDPALVLDWGAGMWQTRLARTAVFGRGYTLTAASRALVEYLLRTRARGAVLFMEEKNNPWNIGSMTRTAFRILRELHTDLPGFELRVVIRPAGSGPANHARFRDEVLRREIGDIRHFEGKRIQVPYEQLAERFTLTDRFSRHYGRLREAGVWIFGSAREAGRAQDWARQKGIGIPENLSLITMENDPRHLYRGISYCGPDWDTIGYLMAHAVIGDFPLARTRRGFVRTPARVVEKLTT